MHAGGATMDGAASQGDRAMQPNLNELLPGAKPWLTGGSSAPDADSENIRCHPPTSLLYCANQEARALALVDEIKRGIAEGDFHLRTR